MKVNLFISLYNISDKVRKEEVLDTLNQNLSNKYIKSIVILNDGLVSDILEHPKVILVNINRRTYFCDYYNYLYQDELNIIANNDIIFQNNIKNLKYLFIGKNDLLALTRTEQDGSLYNKATGDSQDAWIIFGKPNCLLDCNFSQGILGCDPKLNHIFFKNGYRVLNPSKYIKILHIHQSNFRTYSIKDRIEGSYLFTKPIGIFEFYIYRYILKLLRSQSILDINYFKSSI
jgi:hypothetical protein